MEKGKLDKFTQLRWFFQDFPSLVQSNLFNHYNFNPDGEAVPDFKSILKKAYSLIETRKKMIELGTTNIKNDRMSYLIDQSAKKTQLDHPFSGLSALSDSIFQTPFIPPIPLATTNSNSNDIKIDSLTGMMRSLALLVCTF